jgi:hypothetical protein
VIRLRNDNRRLTVGLLLVAVTAGVLTFVSASVASAGESTTTTSESTTTTSESTTTTQQVTTTTAARTTTTPPRASSTTTSVQRSTTSEPSTTLEPTTTSTAAPEIVTDDTLPRRASASDEGGLSTDSKLALVVGGLVAVGLAIGVLTFFYWRHTRPQRYMTALDALADVEQKVPRNPDDVPTAEHAAIAGRSGTPAATAAGVAGATTAVRILEPDEKAASEADLPAASPDDAPDAADGEASLDEPTVITTVEELRDGGSGDGDPAR